METASIFTATEPLRRLQRAPVGVGPQAAIQEVVDSWRRTGKTTPDDANHPADERHSPIIAGPKNAGRSMAASTHLLSGELRAGAVKA
jgi:hypothetical protein